jgi:hypothetical protein
MAPIKPVVSKDHTLTDFKLPKMQIDCGQCGRRGVYTLTHLVARYGPNMPIREFIDLISAGCPQKKTGRCRAGCDDLVGMWAGAPFTSQWQGT